MNNFENLFTEVINKDLCCFCGSCVGLCREQVLNISDEKIVVNKNKNCTSCGICTKVCPGSFFDYPFFYNTLFENYSYEEACFLGHYKNIFVGYSAEESVKVNSSSGGIASTVALYLLKNKLVEAILTVTEENNIVIPKILKTEADVLHAAQSKYVLTPTNSLLSEIKKIKGNFAVIALPCQIQGIRKAALVDKAINEKLFCTIGLFCGFNLSKDATEYLIKKSGFKREEIVKIEYRATYQNRTGFKITTNDDVFFVDKHSYVFLNILFSPKRCWKCFDFSAEFADISIGDAWEKKDKSARVITRTQTGTQIIDQMVQNKEIIIESSSESDIVMTQNHLLKYKKQHYFQRMKLVKNKVFTNVQPLVLTFKQRLSASIFLLILSVFSVKFIRFFILLLPFKFLTFISNFSRNIFLKK